MAVIMDNFKEKHAYEMAKKQVKEIRSFYINLMCYCLVIPILVYVNLTYTPEYYWFPFSMCGWGIGLLFHAMGAFDFMPFLNKRWEEKKIKDLIEHEEQKKRSIRKYE